MMTEIADKVVFKETEYNSNPLILEDDLWNYGLELYSNSYDFKNKYDIFKFRFHNEFYGNYSFYNKELSNFESNISQFLDKNEKLHKNIIEKEIKMPEMLIPYYEAGQNKAYFPEKTYLSIDLVQGYSQVMEYFDFFNGDSWNEFLKKNTNSQLFINSKNIRINIYYGMKYFYYLNNPIVFLIEKILKSNSDIINKVNELKLPFERILVDELIWDVTGHEDEFKQYFGDSIINGIKVHIKTFKHKYCTFKYLDKQYYERIKIFDDKIKLLNRNSKFFAQIYKKYYNLEIKNNDLCYPYLGTYKKLEEPIKNFKFLSSAKEVNEFFENYKKSNSN